MKLIQHLVDHNIKINRLSFSDGSTIELPYPHTDELEGRISCNYSFWGNVYSDHTRLYDALLPYSIGATK